MYVYRIGGKGAKGRSKPWCAKDKADVVLQLFETKKAADKFCDEYNVEKTRRLHNLPPTNKELKKYTVRDIIRSYMHSSDYLITEDHELYDDEDSLEGSCELANNKFSVLWIFSCLPICEKSLFDFDSRVAEKYREDRLKETYTVNGTDVERTYSPTTVAWDIFVIQKAWVWARKNVPSLSYLDNPWKGVEKNATGRKKQRGLKKGELRKLLKACDGCLGTNRYYVSLAIYIFVDTGMRRQELFNVSWEDIDLTNRRVRVFQSKTDWKTGNKGRTIFLPPMSVIFLSQLSLCLMRDGRVPGRERTPIPEAFRPPKGKVFMNTDGKPMTGDAFKQAFDAVRERAGIVDADPKKRLTPHSLRAAAEMLFRRAGLSDKEIDVMKNGIDGHYDVEEEFLDMIQNKMETHYLGMTIEEADKQNQERQKDFESLCEDGLREGLTREEAQERATAAILDKDPELAEFKAKLDSLPSRQVRLAEEVA